MGSVSSGMEALPKKIEDENVSNSADAFIFQSHGMELTATHGRGIPKRNATWYLRHRYCEVHTGALQTWYAHDPFSIPRERKLVYYSGHMEHRKGAHVL